MNCLNCNTETKNPKFCTSSCAATHNNSVKPKRIKQRACKSCGCPVLSSRTYCQSCWNGRNCLNKTLNSNDGNNAYVRQHARTAYKNSGRPYFCALCKYDKHVDICHVRDIRSYPDSTPYSIINHESNLIALCKNHHWEFDHDVL